MVTKIGRAIDILQDRELLFLGSRLKRLAEQMQADVLLVAHRAGLPIQPGQYPVLAILDEQGPTTIGELASAMRLSQPAITKHAARLERAGLVAIVRGEKDRRQSTVSLSTIGREAIALSKKTVWPLVEEAVKEVVEDLSGPFLAQIAAIEERLATRSLSARAQAGSVAILQPAVAADVPAIVSLLNRAYRGTGWNSEAGYMTGDRASDALVRKDMAATPGALLVWRTGRDIQGCVWLAPLQGGTWYLGSLAIDPGVQNAGLGRRLLAASEDWVRERGGRNIRMTVVNVRDGLIAWYERRGYLSTGETESFPYNDERFGIPKRHDLRFIVLRKRLD